MAVMAVDKIEPEIRKQKVALLFQHSRLAILANSINACLLGYVNTTLGAPERTTLLWSLALVAIAVWRLILVHRFRSDGMESAPPDHWLRRYQFGIIVSAAAWGFGTYLFMWHATQQVYLFTGLVVAGTVAGAIPVMSSVLQAYRSFAFLILIPMTLVILLQARSPMEWTFGGMTLFFLGIVLRGAGSLHGMVDASIRLQLEQGALLSRVAQGRDQAQDTLAKLQQKETALEESEARFRHMLETSPIAVRIAAENGCGVLFANRRYAELIQSEAGSALGQDPAKYYASPDEYSEIMARLAEGEAVEHRLVELRMPDGQTKWTLASYASLDYEGTPAVLGWFYDVTESKHAEMALREEEEKMRGLFELSPLGIAMTDTKGRYIEFNDAFQRITGYSRDELQTLDYWALTPEKYKDREMAQLETLERTGHYGPYEKEYVRKDGSLVPLRLNGMYVTGTGGQRHIWSIVEDITERRKTERQLEYLANTDSLTGLLNRRSFMEIADRELRRASRYQGVLSVMMVDIDHFKTINDSHGHRVGDLVLKRFGTLSLAALRGADTIGRIGGEEFAILLPETNAAQALEVGERLRRMVEQERISLEQGLPVAFTLSVGIATLHGAKTNIDTLLSQADEALYRAKQEGRNRVCRQP